MSDRSLIRCDGGRGAEAPPSEEGRPRPYVLLPRVRDCLERLEWRVAVAIGSSHRLETVGHSADEAGSGPPDRQITVVNPQHWEEDLRDWYEENYPGVSYRSIVADTPWEVAIHLLPELHEDIAVAQSDPRWKDYVFGEEPDKATVGGYGGQLTGLTIILRTTYRRSVTPPSLDKLLVAARSAFVDGDVLLWENAVSMFAAFDDSISDNQPRSAAQLETLVNKGWEIILRGVDNSDGEVERFAYLEAVEGEVLRVIETQDGRREEHPATAFQGIRAAHLGDVPVTPSFELLGGGAERTAMAPRELYDHGYVLLPPMEDELDRTDWRVAAAIGSSGDLQTLGHLPGDVATDPPHRRVVAVNPAQWTGDLRTWYERRRSEARVETVEAASPWEMALKILPRLKGDIALAQTDRDWGRYDFGEHPDVGGETIGRYGCFLTGLAIILRRVYGRDVTPAVLDKLLVAARAAYVRDNLMAWRGAVPLFPVFDEAIKDNKRRSALELKELLDEDWEIILRRADGRHFVYLEEVEGQTLQIIDTWDGKRKQKSAADYVGIRAAHVQEKTVREVVPVLFGLHDAAGGDWMLDGGMVGCCVIPRQIQRHAIELDFTRLAEGGIVVIGRLSWGYADGTGTLPPPMERDVFVDAVVETMCSAEGVDYFHVGSEPNNRREWPGFGSGGAFALTPEYVTEIYNEIWCRVDGEARMGPPPIDPYFGPGSDNRVWWTYILENIEGADALFLHAKTQTNDPDEVWSREKFSDWPLGWQFRHLSTVETGLEVVPDRLQGLPVFVSEVNPQCLRTPGGEVGWLPGNAEWVRQAVRYFREEPSVTGVAFYRFGPDGDETPFSLRDRPDILDGIKTEAALTSSSVGDAVVSPPTGLPPGVWRRIAEVRRQL